ncbi:MAG: hypothetical protein CMG61_05090 [Candidatus Marinimicrobia bacterium]|nr:hypothetical protein [Candidatus Neomarinimicrobiota bacterium]
MYAILFSLIFLINIIISQDSIGGMPFAKQNKIKLNNNLVIMPILDIEKLILEDENRPPATPFRYGYKFNVQLNLQNSGEWESLENGDRIWTLSIKSEDAKAISIEYDNFKLPDNSTFFVYNKNKILGAYTQKNNQTDMLFSTPLIQGDYVNLEYYEPFEAFGQGIISIDYIIHDYRDILNFSNNSNSRSCGDNVVCNSANEFTDQINSTSFLDMGGYICSGAMINNTSFDLTPYYWTAWHCVEGDNPSTFRFYFNYETSSCNGSWANQGSYEYGSSILSDSNGMDNDYALLIINDSSISDGIFYSGWSKSNENPVISCGIHHPNGDPKKINFDNDTAYSSGSINWQGQGSSPAGSHWRVLWDDGGTYGGSSGSPVFNEDGLLVGQLSGGSGNCYSGDTEDYYGKFSLSFINVSQWLDPINSGAVQIVGTYDGTNQTDNDNDGVAESNDWDDNDQYVCSDIDDDSCDDCNSGSFDIYDDGLDFDGDGICDAGDIDDDNDGVSDQVDSHPLDNFLCSDIDEDNCDDCSSGYYSPEDDGCFFMMGDLNLDSAINILDVVAMVNIIMGILEPSETQLNLADLNNDNNININDIVLLINIIMG